MYVQLRTAAKHIVYASLVAMLFLVFIKTVEIKAQHPVPGIQNPKLS